MEIEIEIEKEYIVIAVIPSGYQKYFQDVITCDYYEIVKYVEKLTFDAQIDLYFFDIDVLNQKKVMDWRHESVRIIGMRNEKSLADFRDEVTKTLDELNIKKREEKEKQEEAKQDGD